MQEVKTNFCMRVTFRFYYYLETICDFKLTPKLFLIANTILLREHENYYQIENFSIAIYAVKTSQDEKKVFLPCSHLWQEEFFCRCNVALNLVWHNCTFFTLFKCIQQNFSFNNSIREKSHIAHSAHYKVIRVAILTNYKVGQQHSTVALDSSTAKTKERS